MSDFAQAPRPGDPTGVGQSADLQTRFLARLIDLVLLFVVNLVLAFGVWSAVFGAGLSGMSPGTGTSYAAGTVIALVQTAVYLGYFVLLESRNGQTLGKLALRLQTRRQDGGTPTIEQAVRRNVFMAYPLVGLVPVVGWLAGLAAFVAMVMVAVTISQSPFREGWHDRFAGHTKVVRIG